jgi:hypothetical protein
MLYEEREVERRVWSGGCRKLVKLWREYGADGVTIRKKA